MKRPLKKISVRSVFRGFHGRLSSRRIGESRVCMMAPPCVCLCFVSCMSCYICSWRIGTTCLGYPPTYDLLVRFMLSLLMPFLPARVKKKKIRAIAMSHCLHLIWREIESFLYSYCCEKKMIAQAHFPPLPSPRHFVSIYIHTKYIQHLVFRSSCLMRIVFRI